MPGLTTYDWNRSQPLQRTQRMSNPRSLIAYFSREGNNYVGGTIVNLPIGNTEVIARKIQELTGSSTFKIETVKAYPDDYVYAYRWGKSLAKRGKYKEALPLLEQSAPKSYGRNRLWVATWRAYVLRQLDRADEARQQASEALQANGPWFEKDAAELKAVVEGKKPA